MSRKKGFVQYVGKTPIIPISAKILAVFVLLLLLSNFMTNFINIQLNKKETIKLTNQILVDQLKEMYTAATNQFEIYKYSQNRDEALDAVSSSARRSFTQEASLAVGVEPTGLVTFSTSDIFGDGFTDKSAIKQMNAAKNAGVFEGSLRFQTEKGEYLAVYKYHEDWQFYLIRADLVREMEAASRHVFLVITIIIICLTGVFLGAGLFSFRNILKYIRQMSDSLHEMQNRQELGLINLEGAPNDDVTYLGASFNALSSSINNLLGIFQKFVSKDVVNKAYSDHIIKLEGQQRDLTILFSDIRGFTYMTETLGNDIISLLNIHYDRVIHRIHENQGTIGSIIGDAVLAVYGALDHPELKSVNALQCAWEITRVTAELREKLLARRAEIEKERNLTETEERVFKAVLIDVGVGIDGGNVFYGNIGSAEHMTNTVIGDNVNAASRLEGLTRIYHLPVIISQYVKAEVEKYSDKYRFFEIDTVQVKGKQIGKKIYLPLEKEAVDEETLAKWKKYEEALDAYYEGDWRKAEAEFKACGVDAADVFLERIKGKTVPEGWSGIWAMTTK
ncbi:MAG: adenylate/guanylate cyclase domain-containing protein [Treponema sp.]|nr:adenylate/guanylate cyclase domain-containing protein [Candidatus Treponema caballi]